MTGRDRCLEVVQANFQERLSLEPKGCDEEKGWPETALGWADLHPESGGLMAPRQRWEGGRSPISGKGVSREPVPGGHVVRGPQGVLPRPLWSLRDPRNRQSRAQQSLARADPASGGPGPKGQGLPAPGS